MQPDIPQHLDLLTPSYLCVKEKRQRRANVLPHDRHI